MDDIYGRELSFSKESFLTETGHRVCRIKVSRNNNGGGSSLWAGLVAGLLSICGVSCFVMNTSQYNITVSMKCYYVYSVNVKSALKTGFDELMMIATQCTIYNTVHGSLAGQDFGPIIE